MRNPLPASAPAASPAGALPSSEAVERESRAREAPPPGLPRQRGWGRPGSPMAPHRVPRARGDARTLRCFLGLAVLVALRPVAAPAQHGIGGSHDLAAKPVAEAVRAGSSLRIDGRLDEAAWASAIPVSAFTQLLPDEGAPPTERTEVRFLFDEDALYIGARLYDRAPVSTRLGRRDLAMPASDWLTILFDSYHDHRTAFGFDVNPSGVRRDYSRSESGEDDSWDPVWEAATTVDEQGWTAEIRIPFSQLRFNRPAAAAEPDRRAEPVWGLQIERQIARRREHLVFAFTPTSQPGGIARYGHLHGLRELRTGKRLEVLPYTVVRADDVDRSANPYRANQEVGASAGLDLKYRMSADLTLSMTVNPDFGQVEVDPAEVNLTTIETFFREKRPFFVEGAEIFDFGAGGGNNVFYTRRIGRAPQLLPSTPARDVADAARILGAAKLSGRTRSGWSVGILEALTGREEVLFRDAQGLDRTTTAEPLTNYFVGRLRRDARAGQTVLGAMLTLVHRDLDSEGGQRLLRSAAYSGGLDFRHEWARRTWVLSGFVSGSHVQGSGEAIAAAQRAPWRYFQRPDAAHLAYDPERTSLSGLSSQVQLQYRPGRHWRYSLLGATTTPGYEVNDLGYQLRADRIDGQASVTYLEPRPGRRLRSWQTTALTRAERNYAGETMMNRLALSGSVQTLGYWTAFFQAALHTGAIDDRLTRGGPASRRPLQGEVSAELATDPRRPLQASSWLAYSRNVAGGSRLQANLGLGLRPSPRWELRLTPTLAHWHNVAQYLAVQPDPTATHTFGSRYLFAEMRQTTVSLDTRLNLTMSPTLSLQLYAQPFISSADFGAPAELRAPGVFEFLVYGRDIGSVEPLERGLRIHPQGQGGAAAPFTLQDPDFTLRSLRGNAVLRWEWRPGSTLFLAWQQNRSSRLDQGRFDLARDQPALFATRPDNILVLKATYWLNP